VPVKPVPDELGTLAALHRYPVKSMMGEELNACEVTVRGLAGDRSYAVVDIATGKVASAKNPRLWRRLFDFRAAYVEPSRGCDGASPVRVTFPDGTEVTSRDTDIDARLTAAFGREACLASVPPEAPSLEASWPDIGGLGNPAPVTQEAMLRGTFFDGAFVHVLTTATLDALRRLAPEGRFEPRRFRPNLVVATPGAGFVENAWVGKEVSLGDQVVLRVARPCGRCIMTTLPQGDLPSDQLILRTAARHNAAKVGVYAEVLRGGIARRGDAVRLL
jgi:MOSC domain-containing protein